MDDPKPLLSYMDDGVGWGRKHPRRRSFAARPCGFCTSKPCLQNHVIASAILVCLEQAWVPLCWGALLDHEEAMANLNVMHSSAES